MFRNTILCIIDALDISELIKIIKNLYVTKMPKTRSGTLFTKVRDHMQGLEPWFLEKIIKTRNCIELSHKNTL